MTYQFREFYLPEHMMESLDGYASHGIPVGSFLYAVLCNDLAEACGRADEENLRNLPAFIAYLIHEAPPECWGSREKVKAWIAKMAEARATARGDRL